MGQHVDVVVIGSGFGGSVSAAVLAEHGKEVVVLERGKAFPPGSFPRSPAELGRAFWDPSKGLHGMFNVWSFRGIEALVASGLGGGSLIYANVLLRKDEHWFVHDDPVGAGYERWPFTREDLDPHYDEVERVLAPERYPADRPGYVGTPKTEALRAAAERLGREFLLPPLAVRFNGADGEPGLRKPIPVPAYGNLHGLARTTCTLCGECDIGCNQGAKNTLDHTYLSLAAHHGADLRTGCEVRRITARPGGGYEVGYVVHTPEAEGSPTDTKRLPEVVLTADRVVLAAGALGSTFLALRNRAGLARLGPALGTRFSGNGDLLGFVLGADRRLDAGHGPVITGALRVPDAHDGPPATGRGFYVEDAGYPQFLTWLVEASQAPGLARRAAGFAWRRLKETITRDPTSDLSAEVGALLGEGAFSSRVLPLLGMGRDVPDGVLRLRGRKGFLDVDWNTATSEEYFGEVRSTMRDIAGALGGRLVDNPLWLLKRVITVHSLGGMPSGADGRQGVVDPWGQAFGHPGLHVVDGAALPGPVGANPSLTIAAFAHRAARAILEERPVSSDGAPRSFRSTVPPDQRLEPTAPGASRVWFTEEMKGSVHLADSADAVPCMFHLTITVEDLDRFLEDPSHLGVAVGWVRCDAFGGQREVTEGDFNLFVTEAGATEMRYRLPFTDTAGNPMVMSGVKHVHDDPGFDLWADTTTLHIDLLTPDGDLLGKGVLRILVRDLARQLTTFRADGPHPVRAVARFGRLFLGELWEQYGGLASR